MSKYVAAVAVAALAAGCAGEKAPEVPEVTAMAVSATDPAIEQIREDYVTHFNMHHASVVGAVFTDSAVFLGADGSVDQGKAAIIAGMEQTMAGSPTIDITTVETMVMGDKAIARGRYQLGMTPPGGAQVDLSGNYMTYYVSDGGAWKIQAVVTNYDAPPPEGLPAPRGGGDPPPENGTLTALTAAFTEHYNLGHASAVADLFTEDAVTSFPDQAPVEGRAAIEAAEAKVIADGAGQLEIHAVTTIPTTDGWAVDGGWYQQKIKTAAGEITVGGSYMLLARRGDDGAWKIHRMIANSQPVPAS